MQEALTVLWLTSVIHKCHITKKKKKKSIKITCSSGRVRLRGMPNKEQSERRMSDSWLQSEHVCGHGGRNLKEKCVCAGVLYKQLQKKKKSLTVFYFYFK